MPNSHRLSILTLCLVLGACFEPEEPDAQSMQQPSLLAAAEQGDLPGINRLITQTTEVDIRDACLWTPLMNAALNGHREAARRLLEAGADVNLTDKGGYSALMLAASNNHDDLVELLVSAGADLNQVEQTGGFTALIWASQLGHTASVKRLLNAHADTTIKDFDGMSASDRARENGHQDILALLTTSEKAVSAR
jgi:uncharacterized protein